MNPPAREVLTIYWEGEETAGFIIHALRGRNGESVPELARLSWPGGVEVKQSVLHGDEWEVLIWDVRVDGWPSPAEFNRSVQEVLCGLVAEGCAAAWIGLEGYFADPPRLFLPDAMAGGVLAACTGQTGFVLGVQIDAPLQTIDAHELLALRQACGQLAAGF